MRQSSAFIRITLISLISATLVPALMACGQEKNDQEHQVTKIDEFISARGVILRFQDYKLSGFKTRFGGVESRIRKFTNKSESKYFFQIKKIVEYKESTASIEYEDVIEVIGSLEVLKSQFADDASKPMDYMENKFVTTDGFSVGYYIAASQSSWYIVLGDGANETIFINDVDRMVSAFEEARLKIESLRK
jgi:hypothetical protein